MKRITTWLLLLLALPMLTACGGRARSSGSELSAAAEKVCVGYLSEEPALGSEWLAVAFRQNDFGQKRSWQKTYLRRAEAELRSLDGIPGRKSTDYAAAVLGITAAGGDAHSFGGYDLTSALNDAELVRRQGVNGAAYALLALDCGSYESPCREDYIAYLLSRQLSDGGFAVSGEQADPDITSMVIQALAPYSDRSEIAAALDDALGCLSALQRADGGYASWGTVNSESSAQVILALCAAGIPTDDDRFCKNGVSVLDNLLSYQREDGAFSHEPAGDASAMSGIQALLAMAAVLRSESGQRPFDFSA